MSGDQSMWLLEAMKSTAGSRFNAANRLESNDRNLTWITAMTSVYIIALTIIPYFWKFPVSITDSLNLATVVLSIVILVSALLHNSKREAVNAEQHHRSALEINELRREALALGTPLERGDLISFTARYSAVLQKYSVNHTDLDYQKFLIERPEQFPWQGRFSRFKIKLLLMVRDYVQMVILAAISLGCFWLVFIYALPARLAG
jgi:hypothetical protein